MTVGTLFFVIKKKKLDAASSFLVQRVGTLRTEAGSLFFIAVRGNLPQAASGG